LDLAELLSKTREIEAPGVKSFALLKLLTVRMGMRLNYLKSQERGQWQQKTNSAPFARIVVA
jgi:hypothetical protein